MSDVLKLEVRGDGVAVITYDIPGENVNTLRADFADAFESVLNEVESNGAIKAAVLTSGKKDFIVGADIDMLKGISTAADGEAMCKRGHAAVAKLEGCSKPVVAAVHGQALGGGFEVALACHARVIADDDKTMFGLPEVQLGLLPGLNGLQRLARIVGLQAALDYGLTGKNMRVKRAKKMGVAVEAVPRAILLDVAAKHALALRESSGRPSKNKARLSETMTKMALEQNPFGRGVLFKKALETVEKKTRGHYPSPARIIEVLKTFANKGFEASKEAEAKAFGELLQSSVSKQLIGIFFATTALKKDSGVDGDVAPRKVHKIGMLGAGLMGAGITYVTMQAGTPVRLKDRDDASIARGVAYVDNIYKERLKKRQMSKTDHMKKMALLSTSDDYSGFGNVDVVIEAVFEDLDLKHRVLAEVEEHCKDDVIFASNTSSIPIGRIAAKAKRPENVVGMHYFSPVHKMPLLEVIQTDKTSPEVVATAVAIGKKQGKTVIVVRDGVGFYTSRILGPYMNEAAWLLTEGAAIDAIDKAMLDWGFPVGPMALLDEVGIDVAAHVGPIMLDAFGDRLAPPPTMEKLVGDGRKGRKNEKGMYLYGDAAKKKGKGKHVDESIYSLIGLEVPKPGKGAISKEEIQMRCALAFVNEAMHCWGDNILRSPRDGDIGAIFGLGFPPFRGGPFRFVDAMGAKEALSQIERYQAKHGTRWTPAPALVERAKSGELFYP